MERSLKGDFMMADNSFDASKAYEFHNEIMEKEAEKFKKEKLIDVANDVIKDANSVEIVPINAYVLVKPYESSPYQKIEVSESGLALNTMETGACYNTDKGEEDTTEQYIKVGTVIECSPLNKYVKLGDDVIYKVGTSVPVPFFRLGMYVVPETSILAVINEGLVERFKNMK